MSSNRKKYAVPTIAGVAVAAVIALGLGTAVSNANFSSTNSARIDIQTATLVLNASDPDNSGTIDIDFTNLKPGQLISQQFSLTNSGTIPGTVNVGSGFTNPTVPTNPNVTYQNLRVGAGAVSGSIPLSYSNNLPATGWDLGVLQPGETKTFYFDVKLGSGAGNEWQGQSFGGDLPITLTQQ